MPRSSLKGPVHAGDHVADDFGGGVPDAKLLAQGGIEGLKEGLVEVGHGLALVEPGEEGGPVHTVEGRGGPVQHLDQPQGLQPSGIGKLLEQSPQHGGAQVPDGGAPVERAVWRRRLARPQHPSGEDAVEEGLHQGGAEEGRAAVALEADTQGFFQRRPHRAQGRGIARRLDPCQAVAGVGRQQPRQVTGFGQGCAVGQGAAEVLTQGGANVAGEGAGVLQPGLEAGGGLGQPEGLQLGGSAFRVFAQQHEVAGVGNENKAVAVPVAADLTATGGEPGVVVGRLDLYHAALRRLSLLGLSALGLFCGIEAEVGVPRALLGQLIHAIHLGPGSGSHSVQQVVQRRVVGQLSGTAARSPDAAELGEIVFYGRREFGAGCWHNSPRVPARGNSRMEAMLSYRDNARHDDLFSSGPKIALRPLR